ncbi:hypothetical protein MKX08_003668 [Trichoderma sp. CBMAI-0020]|nr:hypothetical protein MKX08_003668 [Trichoderma sp. CBMAI-0020]WOD46221.1 hypothetical protein [Trichoderma atroviride]
MGHRAASSSSALPRFLLSLSASSTSSQQQLHGPPSSPDSACPSTSQDSIELVAIRQHSWSNSNNLLTAAAAAAAPRVVRHKRASLSLPIVAAPSSAPTSGPQEEKIASSEKDKQRGGLVRRGRSSTTSLACSTVSTTDSLRKEKKFKMASRIPLTKQQKWRGGVWAVAFAAVIMVGTLTGAQLKSDKQKEEAIREFRQITPSEQIAMLEKQRSTLVEQQTAMQRKLDVFKERAQERQQEKDNAKKV